MHPVALVDRLVFEREGSGLSLSCNDATLPTDARNLVFRAAAEFMAAAKIRDGVKIHLEKNIPQAAGLGGGSGNAATALLGLNELFDKPLRQETLGEIAAGLGSDIPFFLQSGPALAFGRGETIEPIEPLPALRGAAFLLIHPGFGISTPWAYQQLARFPTALNGRPGRARELAHALGGANLEQAAPSFYNSLEAPALEKFPILALFQEFLRAHGAAATLMSGSGSTTFAITRTLPEAQALGERFRTRFGDRNWLAAVPI